MFEHRLVCPLNYISTVTNASVADWLPKERLATMLCHDYIVLGFIIRWKLWQMGWKGNLGAELSEK